VPVVPQVNVDSAGASQENQYEIDSKTNRDDEGTDRGVVGYRSCSRPTHIEHLELESVDADYIVQGRAKTGGEEAGDNTQTYETDTYEKAALEGLGKRNLDADAKDGKDDRHHHRSAQTDNVTKNCFHLSYKID
jgi:hypothetical protein